MQHRIKSKKDYHETMVSIYNLMNKGEHGLTAEESQQLALMAAAAEHYEDNVLGLKPAKAPQNIAELVAQKMYEQKMNQSAFATKLGIGASKLSEILNGKRRPDVSFLKALYKKLDIDPAFLLDHA